MVTVSPRQAEPTFFHQNGLPFCLDPSSHSPGVWLGELCLKFVVPHPMGTSRLVIARGDSGWLELSRELTANTRDIKGLRIDG
ncbi:hypothetical protein AVEN_197054-1 [Araneus ventricosus]|uniref:Uncharacterized protein n=1 Tax=Araneus ventricosus TaxID=182803 RepID=A0A4Y2HHI4_ARAVE|nr:hypothetical protein AVEN_197054-1 [Araneus ventricosus]